MKTQSKKRQAACELLGWILTFALALGMGLGCRRYVGEPVVISGPSMQDTLQDGQITLLEKVSYWRAEPQRGDIINFYCPALGERLVKRVIAVPHDTVHMENGTVFVNGQALDEPYAIAASNNMEPIRLGEDCYFVLGDNRPRSRDSRDPTVGLVHREEIYGKLWGIVWPLADFQFSGFDQ